MFGSPQSPPKYPLYFQIDGSDIAAFIARLKQLGFTDEQAWGSVNWSLQRQEVAGFLSEQYGDYGAFRIEFSDNGLYILQPQTPAWFVDYYGNIAGFNGLGGGMYGAGPIGPAGQNPPLIIPIPNPPYRPVGAPTADPVEFQQAQTTRLIPGVISKTPVLSGSLVYAWQRCKSDAILLAAGTMDFNEQSPGIGAHSWQNLSFNLATSYYNGGICSLQPTFLAIYEFCLWVGKALEMQTTSYAINNNIPYTIDDVIEACISGPQKQQLLKSPYRTLIPFPSLGKSGQLLNYYGVPALIEGGKQAPDNPDGSPGTVPSEVLNNGIPNGGIGINPLWLSQLPSLTTYRIAFHLAMGAAKANKGTGNILDVTPFIVPAGTVLEDGNQLTSPWTYYRPIPSIITAGMNGGASPFPAPETFDDLTNATTAELHEIMKGGLAYSNLGEQLENNIILNSCLTDEVYGKNFSLCWSAR